VFGATVALPRDSGCVQAQNGVIRRNITYRSFVFCNQPRRFITKLIMLVIIGDGWSEVKGNGCFFSERTVAIAPKRLAA
jgi:hypothetical protein